MKLCPKCQKQFSDDANFCPVDAARLIPLDVASSGSPGADPLSVKFELGDKLGGSRTGTVYRAKDKQSGAAVAVKVIAPQVVALPGVAQRLERELKQLERVQSSGVAKVLASGKRGDEVWVATELLDGAQTLQESISARGPIAVDHAAHLIEVVGEALIEAAQVGVVHRDLAPKNILYAAGEIKLINFPVPVPTTDKTPGVPEFVAPEQVEGKAVDQRSNLYNLGALYYYILTGQTVHAGATPEEIYRAHTAGQIRTPSSLAPVPAPVEAVIMRALDRSPTKRFLTVRQFVDEVGRVARGEADPKATQAMGKAGRPKAELVQTLMGLRGGTIPMGSGATGVPAILSSPASSPTVSPASGPVTEPDLQAPSMPAPVAIAQPSAASLAAAAAPTLAPANNDRSPWAPPGSEAAAAAPAPAAPVVAPVAAAPAAPVVAAPVVAAPVVAAPVLAAPVVAAQPAGKKGAKEEPGQKGKFRETMWFKKGELDSAAAATAAEERARTGKDAAPDKADSLPIDERYKDDGSISRGDKEKYSLRTGATQMMSAIQDPRQKQAPDGSGKVSEDALIGEMKSGRGKIFIAIGVGVVILILVVVLLAR